MHMRVNNKLLNCKPFTIIAIFIHADDTELKHLANILSSVPAIPIMSSKKSFIRSVKRFYKYYDNVLLYSPKINYEGPHFLVDLIAYEINTNIL